MFLPNFAAFSLRFRRLIDQCQLYQLIKVYKTNDPEVYEWILDYDTVGREVVANKHLTVRDFFLELSARDKSLAEAFEKLRGRALGKSDEEAFRARNRVFVPAANGGQYGHLMRLILKRGADRMKGVFCAFYGIRNPITCNECVSRMNVTAILGADGELYPAMSPFDECVSFADQWQDACGNCLFQVQGSHCSYHEAYKLGLLLASRTRRNSGTGVFGLDGRDSVQSNPRVHATLQWVEKQAKEAPPYLDDSGSGNSS